MKYSKAKRSGKQSPLKIVINYYSSFLRGGDMACHATRCCAGKHWESGLSRGKGPTGKGFH